MLLWDGRACIDFGCVIYVLSLKLALPLLFHFALWNSNGLSHAPEVSLCLSLLLHGFSKQMFSPT